MLGLIGAVAIGSLTYFNDAIMKQTALVGHQLPTSVFGGLILFLLVFNPLVFALRRKPALTGSELAVILVITLAACAVPGRGMMQTFTSTLVMPYHLQHSYTGMDGTVDVTPERMLVDLDFVHITYMPDQADPQTIINGKVLESTDTHLVVRDSQGLVHDILRDDVIRIDQDPGANVVVNGFVQGIAPGPGRHIALGDVPWYAWSRTLWFWLPLLLTLWVMLIGCALVVHRQWSEHEQLPYPIATFANALLPDGQGVWPAIFKRNLFWVGAIIVFLLHANNYAATWFPDAMVAAPRRFNLEFLTHLSDMLAAPYYGGIDAVQGVFHPPIYFTAIAFAFLIASDVSLAVAIGPYLFALVIAFFYARGTPISIGGHLTPKVGHLMTFGGYVGMFAVIAYTGRQYFKQLAAGAVGARLIAPAQRAAVWAARVAVLAGALMVIQLVAIGLDWFLATLFAVGLVVLFVVMARILAETGIFFLMPWWGPGIVMIGLLGATAVGPQTQIILLLITVVMIYPQATESIILFMTNALKLLDVRQIPYGRATLWCVGALLIAVVIALPLTLYFQYDRGVNSDDAQTWRVPRHAYLPVMRSQLRLASQGQLETANRVSGLQRLVHVTVRPDLWAAMGVGLVLVLACSAARLRWPGWPVHPVMFLIWTTAPGRWFCASFMVGWLIKRLVVRFGGTRAYQLCKPLMFGVIAGEMLAGVLTMLIGAAYYLITGQPPPKFSIF